MTLFRKFEGLGAALAETNQTLGGLNANPAINHLRHLCETDGRICRLGLGESLSIKVGTVSSSRDRSVTDAQAMEPDEIKLELDAFLLMTNLHPEQRAWEERARKVGEQLVREVFPGRFEPNHEVVDKFLRGKISAGEGELPKGSGKGVILANVLLDLFEKCSGSVIVERLNMPAQQKVIKLVIESHAGTEFSLSRCFRFAPCYLQFAENESYEASKAKIASNVVCDVFERMADLDYMMDAQLKKAVNPLFESFIASGIRDEREGFCSNVKENLSLFLHGTPGIGKSTFVHTFAVALQAAIREYLDNDIQVNIVKIPLNAYANAWNLNQILQIQGISDWSVERLMEQSLTKGNLVLLHLEESPQSAELQDTFFACLNKMLDRKLWFRYPEYKSNVMFVFTSNYAPSETVNKFCRAYCTLMAPTAEMQRVWLKRKLIKSLKSKICERTQCPDWDVSLSIDDTVFPKATTDVRPLNAFWISLGYALWRQFRQNFQVCGSQRSVSYNVRRTDASGLELSMQDGANEELKSDDGYFYFSPSNLRAAIPKAASTDSKSLTILDMAVSGDLTPAVIVLKDGSVQWQDAQSKKFTSVLKEMLRPSTMFAETDILLLEADDEVKVLGESGEIRGGLMKFIDDATNPNSASKVKRIRVDLSADQDKQADVCLVRARVNELGSVFLREMLEAGDKSRTHRLGVSKRGLVFIISLVEGATMTPQLESRAHQIISGLD